MHNKLGEFIRMHREGIQPADVGLPDIGRRRTPGLRREELAQLCAVSPTWLTWIEQGRLVSASTKVLAKLADVMRLTAAERGYLFRLADKLDPAQPGEMDGASHSVAGAAIVAAIKAPAYILNQRWDAVAWNRPASDLFVGWLAKPSARARATQANLLNFMFLAPGARALIADWPDRAQRLVAEFRADCGKYADQEPLAGMIQALARESAEFARLWNSQQVVGRDGGTRRFVHPLKGELSFEQVSFSLASGRGMKLVMLLPGQ
ncbi:MAG TPA: XRE family transcriptional regulator [Janthinobacterium sp.]|nr:XRE family transcriptional regulator [Janthinobacterium sp.]